MPVKRRTWPDCTTFSSSAMALSNSVWVNFAGSAPCCRRKNPMVSPISVSIETLPLRSDRVQSSDQLPTSLVNLAL